MYIALDIFCFSIPLTMLFAIVLSAANGVGGCQWPISARNVLMDVAFWKFSNNAPNYASVIECHDIYHYSEFYMQWSISRGHFLYKCVKCWFQGKYPPALLSASVSDTQDASEYIFYFFCILLMCPDGSHCSFRNWVIYFSLSIIGFVCTAVSEFGYIRIVGSMAPA